MSDRHADSFALAAAYLLSFTLSRSINELQQQQQQPKLHCDYFDKYRMCNEER